jgi:hypothetical protein
MSSDFDFFMGSWKCRHRYLVKRLADCHDCIEFDGSCEVRRIAGFGNIDENEIELPGDAYRGVSLRTWDPTSGRWSIYWLDSRRPGGLFPPVHGGFDKGIGTFYGDDTFAGHPIRVRYLWSRITGNAARWEQAFSLDEGNNWETNWYMDFTRV